MLLSFTGDSIFDNAVRLFFDNSCLHDVRHLTCILKPERSVYQSSLVYTAVAVEKQMIETFNQYVKSRLSEYSHKLDKVIVVLPGGTLVPEPEEPRRYVQNEVLLVEMLSDLKTRLILNTNSVSYNWTVESTLHDIEVFDSAVNVPGGDVLVMNDIILTGRHDNEVFKPIGESVADYTIVSLKQKTKYTKKSFTYPDATWSDLFGWDESDKLVAPLYDLDLYLCVLERLDKVVFFVGELKFDEYFYKDEITVKSKPIWEIISYLLDKICNKLESLHSCLKKQVIIKRLPILLGGNLDNCVSYCNGVIDDNGDAGRFMVAAPTFSEHSLLSEKSILEANSQCDAAFEGLNVKVSRMNVSADDVRLKSGGLHCRSKVIRRFPIDKTSSTS